MTSLERSKLREQLMDHEGVKMNAYPDSLGYTTIGVGRLIDSRKGGGLSPEEVLFLLDNDINACLEDLTSFPWWQGLDVVRQRALIDMRFQLGKQGFLGFGDMLEAMSRGAHKEAADHARDSKWAKHDTPERAKTVTRMLDTGVA